MLEYMTWPRSIVIALHLYGKQPSGSCVRMRRQAGVWVGGSGRAREGEGGRVRAGVRTLSMGIGLRCGGAETARASATLRRSGRARERERGGRRRGKESATRQGSIREQQQQQQHTDEALHTAQCRRSLTAGKSAAQREAEGSAEEKEKKEERNDSDNVSSGRARRTCLSVSAVWYKEYAGNRSTR